jgi:hypothetical protein
MSDALMPDDIVGCDRYSGNPTIPAKTCAMRSMWLEGGYGYTRPRYPVCYGCPVGADRRARLEAGGWRLDLVELKARLYKRRAGARAAARKLRAETIDPPEEE